VARSKKAEPPPSDLVQKGLPCEDCRSSDALALYSDGHTHCFSCGKTRGGTPGEVPRGAPEEPPGEDFPRGSVKAIRARGLTQETCREWDYQVRQNAKGEVEHLAFYRDPNGRVVGCKVRNVGVDGTNKEFSWVGNAKGNLYGRHKWSAGGRILTICEGEIDTLTVSQCYAHKYPVVGIPNGAPEAAKSVAKNLDWINTFEKVVIALDMDPQGRDAAIECAKLLPPGKAFIVKWPGGAKDPNELLQAGKGEEITRAIWQAEAYRPDGIVDARSLTAEALNPRPMGRPWPWKFMTEWTYGRRHGELYTFGAGSGIGKTDAFAEIIAATLQGTTADHHAADYEPESFGVFAFEGGGPVQLKLRVAGKIASRRFHLPNDPEFPAWSREELIAALDLMDTSLWSRGGKLFINDHRGTSDWASIKDRMRYLRHAENVRNFLVDPLSAMVAGEEDERKALDAIVLEYALLMGEIEATGYLASHLTRPKDGPTHEEGGQVRLGQFRGSNGIGMYSDFVFGWERNTQAGDGTETRTKARCVKDRLSGNFNGRTSELGYDQITGRLEQATTQFIGDV
jgi:twinkle protein